MKKLYFTVMFLLITVSTAYAGIFGTIGGYIKGEAIGLLITAAVATAGAFGIKHYVNVVKELGEVIWQIYRAVQPSSAGGKTITKEEMEAIIKEAQTYIVENPTCRYGQAIYNVAFVKYTRYVKTLTATEFDCYYNDSKVNVFLNELERIIK